MFALILIAMFFFMLCHMFLLHNMENKLTGSTINSKLKMFVLKKKKEH